MTGSVLLAGFMHETNTFSRLPTDLEAYRARNLYRGEEVVERLTGTRTEMAGFLEACERYGWSPVTPVYANATPSGPVTRHAFETVAGDMLAALDGEGPFDAVLLALHGAMVTEHVDDGEGELLGLIRDRVGAGVPIAVTLDLHANVTDRMAELADVMIAYRTYPHVDQYEVATEAAALVARALAGDIAPVVHIARGPMLDGADHGRTTSPGPMTEVLASAERLMDEPGVLAASLAAGFPWADILETGPCAILTADGSDARFAEMAERLIDEVWEKRTRLTVDIVGPEQAIAAVVAAGNADKPVVLADFADNPGGGGYGDATGLLRAMVEADLDNAAFATLYDPDAAAACVAAGIGATVTVALGGRLDPRYGGPLEVTGKVRTVTDGALTYEGPMMAGMTATIGPTAVLGTGGLDIVVTSCRYQVYDRAFFTHAGIVPERKSVVAVKSAHHFRAAFGPIASAVYCVDAGGLTSRNFKELPFEKVRRPVYPLDMD